MSVKATVNGRTFTLSWSEFEKLLATHGIECVELHNIWGGANATS